MKNLKQLEKIHLKTIDDDFEYVCASVELLIKEWFEQDFGLANAYEIAYIKRKLEELTPSVEAKRREE